MLSLPRLGIKGTHTIEGLHGLAYSGPANWAVKGPKASPTTIFPQAIGLAQMWDSELLRKVADWQAVVKMLTGRLFRLSRRIW